MMQYWSWLLAVIGVTGIFLVGRKTIWGWLILCVNEVLWIAYALATDQYGFIAMAVAYVITKNAALSVTIAFWETVVKVFIYYAHERGWNYIQWGRK